MGLAPRSSIPRESEPVPSPWARSSVLAIPRRCDDHRQLRFHHPVLAQVGGARLGFSRDAKMESQNHACVVLVFFAFLLLLLFFFVGGGGISRHTHKPSNEHEHQEAAASSIDLA